MQIAPVEVEEGSFAEEHPNLEVATSRAEVRPKEEPTFAFASTASVP